MATRIITSPPNPESRLTTKKPAKPTALGEGLGQKSPAQDGTDLHGRFILLPADSARAGDEKGTK